MRKVILMAGIIALPVGLAGCDKTPEAPKAEASADAMGDMAMATAVKHGKGIGTVTAIEPAKGTVTLNHGEISGLHWPAMTMGFRAKPELLSGIKVGDKVVFEIDWDSKAGSVTKIAKSGS